MRHTAEAVIIGGGVVGASIAYHLTRGGMRDVVIVEREPVPGLGSTGRATGGVRAQFSQPIDIQISLYSLGFFRSFKEATGVDPGYRPNGYLFLATTEEEHRSLTELVMVQHGAGLTEVRLVGREEITRMVPSLFAGDVVGGSFCPLDGFIEPLEVLRGLL